ncbi:hypothetical protein [Oricola cellulosilytica]|uniref:Uncharacterized protein n=1 Tax=Oricola cellulosilytica TaxID=1429082 RepID=A0A4R0PCR1_9HYPH|nr:hypothetical protein [Oricola cellulosilytica]TCD15261.1 hypothetical protein E0D97_06915 [Oricola cellulosilytica]
MKQAFAFATIITVAAAGQAAADSSALDVYHPVKDSVAIARMAPTVTEEATSYDFTATASIREWNEPIEVPRLGDGSPRYK